MLVFFVVFYRNGDPRPVGLDANGSEFGKRSDPYH